MRLRGARFCRVGEKSSRRFPDPRPPYALFLPRHHTAHHSTQRAKPEMSDVKLGGKYSIEEELKAGGCGVVYLGVHDVAGKQGRSRVLRASSEHNAEPCGRVSQWR